MKADSIHLLDFLGNGKTIFEIPVFQRNYEWGAQQCQQLFNDLTIAAQDDLDHFIGTIVYVADTGKQLSHIHRMIDGQQRLTSLTLLLKAIANADEADRPEIEEAYLTNKYLDSNHHLRLKPVKHDIDAFYTVMDGSFNTSQPSKIIDNYRLFVKWVAESQFSSHDLYEAMNHFNMVYIELSDKQHEENPQVIFESLNSTGVSLSASDLVRNFLLMKLDSERQSSLYEQYWVKIERLFVTNAFAEFIRHYLIMKTHREVKKSKVYDSYKNYFNSAHLTSEAALSDLLQFANIYSRLLTTNTTDAKFNTALRDINVMKNKAVYPYLMLLLDLVQLEEIDQSTANDLIHLLESHLFRVKICQAPTNRLKKIVISLCDLEKAHGNLKDRLLQVLKPYLIDDKTFTDSLMQRNLYLEGSVAKLTLEILEERQTKETIDFSDAQVEHIMPQTLSPEWVLGLDNAYRVNEQYGGTIGNLTLTKYNQEMGNKPYSVKQGYYKTSNIQLTREVAENYNKWDKAAIINRSEQLAKRLVKIFPVPNIKAIDMAEVTGDYLISEDVNVTGKKPTRLTINGDEYAVDSWRQLLITFLNVIWDQDSLSFLQIKDDNVVGNALFNATRRPAKLKMGMTIETNFSSRAILVIIIKISKICHITDQVSYTVR